MCRFSLCVGVGGDLVNLWVACSWVASFCYEMVLLSCCGLGLLAEALLISNLGGCVGELLLVLFADRMAQVCMLSLSVCLFCEAG